MSRARPHGIFRRLPSLPDRRENRWEETPAENDLSIKGKAYIAGIYEHPTRHAPDKSTAQLHAEVAKGALKTPASPRPISTAISAPATRRAGRGDGRLPRPEGAPFRFHRDRRLLLSGPSRPCRRGDRGRQVLDRADHAGRQAAHRRRCRRAPAGAEADFEAAYGATTHNTYGMCAMRHMHEYGTTSEQLAWIKVAASHHAQYNRARDAASDVVTVEDVLNSPMISDPLHRHGLLRRHRRRRRADRHHAGDRQEPEEAAGADDRPRRGA